LLSPDTLSLPCRLVVVVIVFIDSLLPASTARRLFLAGGDGRSQNGHQSDEGMVFERSSKAINRYGMRLDLGPCKFATRPALCSAGTSSPMSSQNYISSPVMGPPLRVLNHGIQLLLLTSLKDSRSLLHAERSRVWRSSRSVLQARVLSCIM